ncbi:UNVERIFIED_CONTAM: hypothetical protein Sradi_0818600 [Sesamum radiatum]|uniref:Retrotransposon gag domain-containing protein n=1 Tax=Sesamum radiatum TaxID=300843 RepID=A0AAW2VU95_SESRA
MWNDLDERFSQGNTPRIHQLKTEMMNTLQQGMTVSAYYTKLKGIWDELGIYSQIPPCTCGSAKAFTAQEERQQLVTTSRSTSIDAAAFLTNHNNNKTRKPTSNRDLSKLFCENCKKPRHTKDTCFGLYGYHEWWDKGKKSHKGKEANNSQRIEPIMDDFHISGLTSEQYAQLISVHNLEKSTNSTANFAGLSHEEADWNG